MLKRREGDGQGLVNCTLPSLPPWFDGGGRLAIVPCLLFVQCDLRGQRLKVKVEDEMGRANEKAWVKCDGERAIAPSLSNAHPRDKIMPCLEINAATKWYLVKVHR